jgi:cyclopropane-fatty-acyl-phospholipid synthase
MDTLEAVAASSTHLPFRQRLAAQLVLRQLSRWKSGALTLTLPHGRGVECGDRSSAQRASLTVRDWKFFWRALTAGDIGVGESYMAGEWESADLVQLCRLFLRDQTMLDDRSAWTVLARLRHALLRLARRNTLAGSRRNIKYHYDLSNDLYRLFLDASMTYSCAVFEPPDMSLEAAQLHKVDDICRRLALVPGMHILEIGSGWGAFAIHAARQYGCRVTSLTLSDEQLRLARARVAAAGVEALVDLRLCDYRTITGSFDRIVSIEMFEAVGYQHYRAFFAQCSKVLKPGGAMFLQTIHMPDQRFDAYRRDFDWIRKYIFPGSLLASVHGIAAALKAHTAMRIDWMRDIGVHYARTLRLWRERFMQHLPEVRRLGFDERFIRMWEFYLASCEASFASRYIGDVQMILLVPASSGATPAAALS